ncbi:alkaline phosphatase [Marixanthomonas spongiae]|uniref:Alkaline phosphatase n=1 Tax=Marixanthomonas spongiae TaxID=2174845 RepID=A0A2U0HWS5_9FLAO|nr:alkaline phosphatase [Marixanthomonas spongiae]PVW13314.1 alkaline phosphatase [Marixanthomonas spongiae]
MKRLFLPLSALLLFLGTNCVSVQVKDNMLSTETVNKTPKNVILLIGDGMGLSQVSSALFFQEKASNFERFPTIGLIKTSSGNDVITDSAAGATAFASGVKTYNGAIGVNIDTIPVPTILEEVSRKGLSTGLVATSSIVHATPASFFAHVKYRRQYDDIAAFMPTSDVDFFAGGGQKFFNDRKDGRNLYAELEGNGFQVYTDKLPTKFSDKKEAILLAEDGMPKKIDGRADFLPDATQLAIENLTRNKDGFFLMVEGSQIDWGGHANEADYLIGELLDFDKTIGVALDFAKINEETLVIVTADHETGGYTLASKDGDYNQIAPSFSTGGHSATMIPVFAKGPGAEHFNGIYENTEIYTKIKQLLLGQQ